MIEVRESPLKITLGATVLVDYDAWFEGGLPKIDQTGEVQEVKYVRAAGGKTFDRGNRMHSISWTVMRLHESPQAAEAFRLHTLASLPTGGVDLIIEVMGHEGEMVIASATITDVQTGTYEQCSRITYALKGGAITGAPLALMGRVLTEEGDGLLTEDGSTLMIE
ncbi:hypothetical protein [Verrucomicrobium spinosum]|uniref:hypothetical protein n=1 Tax=Verrucomicrobium spinosum TaxID=2736 RepID=UPI0001745048|nr:hypothetical protein [Verrucomicrobium spinosum]